MSGWPWPLDGVQRWFESLWNWISAAAVNAVSVVSDWVWSAIAWLKDRVTEVGTWIWNQIKPVLGPVAGWIANAALLVARTFLDFAKDPVGFISRAVSWIGDVLNKVWNSLAASVNAVGSSLAGALGAAQTAITGAVTGIASTVSSAVGGAVNTLSTAFNGAMATVGGWVSDALAGVAKAMGEALTGFASWFITGLKGLAATLAGGLTALMNTVNAILSPVILMFVDKLRSSFKVGSPDEKLQKAVDNMVETTQNRVLEELKKAYKSPFDPLQMVAVASGIAGIVIAAQVGVHGLASAAGVEVLGTRIDLTDVVEGAVDTMSLNRAVGATFMMPLEVGLLTPLRYAYNQMFTPLIPGVGDLIRFVVREVITPAEFYSTMPFHGFSERWARAYWDAHWVLPGYAQLVDAYHRGTITTGDLDKFVVWHDYSPESRPGVSKTDLQIMRSLMKTLIPRVDLRRGWEFGALSDGELEKRYELLGYEEDAPLMAEIQKRVAMEAEIGKLRDNSKADYAKGYILEADLRNALETLGYGPATIQYHVSDAVQDRERRRKDLLVDNYLDAYVKGLIATESELQDLLATVIVDSNIVSVMVEDAYTRRYKKPKGEVGG